MDSITSVMKPNRRAVYEYVGRCPYTPTLREIGDAVNLSPSTVLHHLRALERAGHVRCVGSRYYVPPKSILETA